MPYTLTVTDLLERLARKDMRIKQLEDENALLKRALAMLTRSLENANDGGDY